MSFTLLPLPYAYEALEPHIDTLTMQIHHGKHHQAYVDNLNKAVAGTPNEGKSLEELVKHAGTISPAVRNNGGGHWILVICQLSEISRHWSLFICHWSLVICHLSRWKTAQACKVHEARRIVFSRHWSLVICHLSRWKIA